MVHSQTPAVIVARWTSLWLTRETPVLPPPPMTPHPTTRAFLPTSDALSSEKNTTSIYPTLIVVVYKLNYVHDMCCNGRAEGGIMIIYIIPHLFSLTLNTLWDKDVWNNIMADLLSHILLKYKFIFTVRHWATMSWMTANIHQLGPVFNTMIYWRIWVDTPLPLLIAL